MTTDLLTALPNLGVGVASILVLYLVLMKVLDIINKRDEAMRSLEKEIRDNIMKSLGEATAQIGASSHLMTRIVDYLDRPDIHPTRSSGRR